MSFVASAITHAPVAPILLPLLAGCVLLMVSDHVRTQRTISLFSCLLQLMLVVLLLANVGESAQIYRLGNWAPPFGIALVLDRLAVVMLFTAAMLAMPVLIYACNGDDEEGRYFHPLFQFQLVGIYGAFLTGDLFNLFVFFEILLIASYGLLLHGSNATINPHTPSKHHVTDSRVTVGIQYVVLNLIGSALFLLAAGIFYGVAGTLNFADIGRFVVTLDINDVNAATPLLVGATLLLALVFGLKAAIVPLHFWLPRSYSAANASVAALFAIMSKIGIYALLRLQTTVLASDSVLHDLLNPWLLGFGVLTLAIGAIGAIAATALAEIVAYLMIISIGTLTVALGSGSVASITALLFYLVHSTWIGAAMFLLAAQINQHVLSGGAPQHKRLFANLFLIGAIAVIGMPPLSGFIGKLLILQSTPMDARVAVWPALLLGSLAALIALTRFGISVFWKNEPISAGTTQPLHVTLYAIGALLVLGIAMSIGAAPVVAVLDATAQQLAEAHRYVGSVLPTGALH